MEDTAHRAIAIVGCGAVLPDAPNVSAFWKNVTSGRYSITEVPPDRWDPALFYDPDHNAPDKTYSKIGGWVREYPWEPLAWRLPVPPRVADAMDIAQKWAIASTREALADYGYPERPLNTERTAVILGNAMGGEMHYLTALRAYFPEFARELEEGATFATLPQTVRQEIAREFHKRVGALLPPITEDSMPGELANCLAGRLANIYNFRGPNFTCDAACASAMAAIRTAAEGLIGHEFDVAVTGGIDRNMGPSTFIKFSKIGALSATGSRPYAEGADGFVMGEGTVIFLMKRLADAERDGDRIYAVLRGVGASSDGRGKGITAPNPVGQKLCIERAWENAGVSPATATLIEGHGTSTGVGDVVEYEALAGVLKSCGVPPGAVALGSVKSNVGHLKGSSGAAGLLKITLALRDKVLPPSVKCEHPNPKIDFAHSALRVNTELQPWTVKADGVRRAGASAFGFGGTNFHTVLEEYVPHRLTGNSKHSVMVGEVPPAQRTPSGKVPLRGALVTGGATRNELAARLRAVQEAAAKGHAPAPAPPSQGDLSATDRIAIDYTDAADLAEKAAKAVKALASDQPAVWKVLRAQGIFRGHGAAPKVAFLYTGQGSQYVNMMQPLRKIEPIVAETFAEADRIMTPLLGKPLSDFIFVEQADPEAVAQAEEELRQTAITQPAVLATDLAMTRLLAAYGIRPDMTMGHSLGEYGALEAAGGLPFADALEAVSARGREMTRFSTVDNGKMAAVFGPIAEIERILKTIDGYVVIANLNSDRQAVIGGASRAVELASAALEAAGYNVVPLTVSHAFHTSIVAGASEPLRSVLQRLHLKSPDLPVVTNVTGTFYPTGPDAPEAMLDILAKQVYSPVQFIKGLRTLYEAGARVFVEVGPKKALHGFVEDVLGEHPDVIAFFTNHPKIGDVASFNQALCGLYAAGLGAPASALHEQKTEPRAEAPQRGTARPVVITGASLGLPGGGSIFDDTNVARILRGEQFIDVIPTRFRNAILDKHITRLVKTEHGDPAFETITQPADVLKLAARGGAFNLGEEFGIPADRMAALDRVTSLAIGAGFDALRDAGIPLTLRYKTTTKGTQLPDRWGLPDAYRDDTGVIFASVFPGYDSFADEMARYYGDRSRREQVALLASLRDRARDANGSSPLADEIKRRIAELEQAIAREPYSFDRRFLFHVLSMGHSQFAELIGARGPNTQVNAACASTTQAIAVAEDWIRAGRCRRVIVISADDITSDHLMEWFGAGFLASGAAATDDVVENAAIPFDRRRHGLILGMGAAALVVETPESAAERGVGPICDVVGAVTANSAFHGTRLDIQHIRSVMETVVRQAEEATGVSRHEMAPRMVFVSHETYTPARGGSASAEINALRAVFGAAADQIVIANTKGFTGHAMGTGIEDVVAVKALETGLVPPVANFKEVDPELGPLNLSKGGAYPIDFALRLGAGFGSQISMSLLRRTGANAQNRPNPADLGYRYRINDEPAWKAWVTQAAGHPAELEVVKRTLRVRDQGANALAVPTAQLEPAHVESVEFEPVQVARAAHAVQFAAAPVAAPVAVQAAASPAAKDPVKERVLALVAEKTGYPIDMLDLDLDLEADLGVDTVKQAEVLAAIRERYGIAREDNMKLRDFPTLAHVIQFVYDRKPNLAAPAPVQAQAQSAVPAPAPEAPPVVSATNAVQERILDMVVEKTGYPRDMLDLDLDLEADLGVDTVKQAEMFASIREIYSIPRDPDLKLRDFPTLAKVIGFVFDRRPDLKQAFAGVPAPRQSAAPAVQPAASATNAVEERILDLVVEKTGYPRDMLDLDLDLEADLGVDTVKQAEMFASIREIYSIPRDPDLKLRDFPTLAKVIGFVFDRRPDLKLAFAAPAPPQSATPAVQPAASAANGVEERILDLVVEKTGYPRDMLDLDLDLEADLGVDTVKQAEMFASIREIYSIPRDPDLKLRDFPTLTKVIGFVFAHRPDLKQAAAAAPAPTAAVPPGLDPIQEKVLAIMAEKTGYPKEMLDVDLDLEADLGVDTVKQAEMFASVRAEFGIPRDQELKLRDFPTLAHVIQFARDRRTTGVTAPVASEPVTVPASPAVPTGFGAADTIPRRVPVPQLRPPLAACKATGVSLAAGQNVAIMNDQGGVGDALAEQLRTMGVEVLSIEEALTAGPVHGVFWLPALDFEGPLAGLDPGGWRDALEIRVKSLYTTMRGLYDQIASAGTFLVTATRLGGQHGYDDAGAFAPLGGAVTGFTKTYKRERPDALVKAIDFEPQVVASEVASLLIAETLRDPGAVEIGYQQGLRWTIGLEERPVTNGQPGLTLDNNTVFLITGAAGGIVSAITSDLAAASGGTFYLLDLVPEPDPQNPDLDRFVSDKDGLKRELFARIQARGERATPAMVEKELAGLERANAARSAIDAVRTAGGTAHYFSVNLNDPAAVAGVIDQIREQSGRIDVLLHAAGLERSRLLPDKDPAEFDLVFNVKADGWFNLLHAIGDMPLGATVAFSSIAGRFGNAGQADYSSANDLMCKIASSFRTTRPATRAMAMDWTAWGGIGMATRGSIPKMMELAGIDMLPPEAGVPWIRRELTAGSGCGEVVVGNRLGVMLNPWDQAGGLDTAAALTQGPMLGHAAGIDARGEVTFEVELDPKAQPFLYDHQIEGTPVLPGVMGIEAFAEAAVQMFPGWQVDAIEDIDFLAPFKFYRNDPRTLAIQATFHAADACLLGDCRLIGRRLLPNQTEPQVTTHFTARVRMTRQARESVTSAAPDTTHGSLIEAADIYRVYFHGPAYQMLKRAWWEQNRITGEMAAGLPDNHQPVEQPLAAAPRLVELCFQTAGLLEMAVQHRMGLPRHVDRVTICRPAAHANGPLFAVVTAEPARECFDAEVVDGDGNRYVQVTGYKTVVFREDVTAELLLPLATLAV